MTKKKEKEISERTIEWEIRDGILKEAIEDKIKELKSKIYNDEVGEDNACDVEELNMLYGFYLDLVCLDQHTLVWTFRNVSGE